MRRRLVGMAMIGAGVLGLPTWALAQSMSAVFDASTETPRCFGFGASCDSAELLVGRGPAGPEVNAPNTTGSTCADGALDPEGFHLWTPTSDRIRVFTSDGSAIARHKPVQIEITVFSGYNTYGLMEVLDVFETDDSVMPPVWRHIGSAMPFEHGFHSYTFSYTPGDAPINRAIRSAYRTGDFSSTLPCGGVAVDDHDDLWFRMDSSPGIHVLAVDVEAASGSSGTIDVAYAGGGAIGSCAAAEGGEDDCFFELDDEAEVVLTAVPNAGAGFVGWTGACSGTSTCSLSLSQARQVGAAFGPGPKTLTLTLASVDGGSGSVAVSPIGGSCSLAQSPCAFEIPHGSSVTLDATPAAGSTFGGWSGGGCAGTEACTLAMDTSRAVTAELRGAGRLSIGGADASEGDDGTTSLTFTVTLTQSP